VRGRHDPGVVLRRGWRLVLVELMLSLVVAGRTCVAHPHLALARVELRL
jgi:hypothetical protein